MESLLQPGSLDFSPPALSYVSIDAENDLLTLKVNQRGVDQQVHRCAITTKMFGVAFFERAFGKQLAQLSFAVLHIRRHLLEAAADERIALDVIDLTSLVINIKDCARSWIQDKDSVVGMLKQVLIGLSFAQRC